MDSRHILVTGGCGFIGSNFVRHMIASSEARITNLDKLTYAGNLENLRDLEGHPRYAFVKGDIADRADVEKVFSGADRLRRQFCRRVPRGQEHPRPGRVREDEHLRDLPPPRAGAPPGVREIRAGLDRRGVRQPAGDGEVHGGYAPFPNSPYSASKASADMLAMAYHRTFGLPGSHHALLEQLRPLPVPGEADTASRQQRPRRPAAAHLRRRAERARLDPRRGPLRGAGAGAGSRRAGPRLQRWRGEREDQPGDRRADPQDPGQAQEPHNVREGQARPRPQVRHRQHQDKKRAGLRGEGAFRPGHGRDGALVRRQQGVVGEDQDGGIPRLLREVVRAGGYLKGT